MEEDWRDIPEFPGWQASNYGRIRSLSRSVEQASKWGGSFRREYPSKVLKPSANSHGYLHVSPGRAARSVTVHRLIASAFLGPRPVGMTVNHKDGNKQNNTPGNLEYVSAAANNAHALETGLRKVKVDQECAEKIRAFAATASLRKTAEWFGVSHTYVRYVLRGKGRHGSEVQAGHVED